MFALSANYFRFDDSLTAAGNGKQQVIKVRFPRKVWKQIQFTKPENISRSLGGYEFCIETKRCLMLKTNNFSVVILQVYKYQTLFFVSNYKKSSNFSLCLVLLAENHIKLNPLTSLFFYLLSVHYIPHDHLLKKTLSYISYKHCVQLSIVPQRTITHLFHRKTSSLTIELISPQEIGRRM